MSELADRLLAGEQRALSRLISMLERGDPAAAEVMRDIDVHAGRAYTLGITGPPGAGKSTIVDQLTRLLREQGQRVGIVAVDPTSPFSGGALLGDRIRMQRHYLDSGVIHSQRCHPAARLAGCRASSRGLLAPWTLPAATS